MAVLHNYVEYPHDRLGSENQLIYNNDKYVIKYFEGCFMPFVCKVNNENLNNKGDTNVK